EDVTRVTRAVAQRLYERQALLTEPAGALELHQPLPLRVLSGVKEALGGERKSFAGEVLAALEKRRTELCLERIHKRINWELFDRGVEAYTWAALEEVGRAALGRDLLEGAEHGEEYGRFVAEAGRARNGRQHDG